jgi:hypothetical protein
MFVAVQGKVHAHQKWLWPNRFSADEPPVWVSFDVTWSDQPFTADQGAADQALWIVDPQGRRSAPPEAFAGKTKTTAEAELTAPGTYRLEAVDPPTYWTRLEVNGKEQWHKVPKSEAPAGKITRSDLYYSKAVAYVTVGKPSPLSAPDKKEPMDIQPQTHPSLLATGEEVALRTLLYSQPAGDAQIKVFGPSASGHDPDETIDCDDQGVAKFRPSAPGRYLVSCEMERTAKDDPKADIHSFNVFLTLWVKPAEK